MKGFEAAAGLRRETRNLVTFPELFTVPPRISRNEIVHTAPFLPLDQVFERGVTVTELHRGPTTGSDHLPVVFTFAVAKDQRPS
jgi:endonuclease/exonuclease/phosphatase (EEP) superfamily protein YafD